MMKVEFFFENITKFIPAHTKFEETVQVVQVLIARCSRACVEFLLHSFGVRLFRQFCYLLFVELAQHHFLLHFRQLVNGEKERIFIAITEKARLEN